MTTTIEPGVNQRVITPTAAKVVKRWLFWVGALLFALLVGFITIALSGSSEEGVPLSPTNPAPRGAMAVAEVLRQQGVEVTPTSSLEATRDAISNPGSTTLVIYDADLILDESQLRYAVALADRVVLVDPSFGELEAVAPGIAQAGFVGEDPLAAECDVSSADRAGQVSGGGSGYRVTDDAISAVGCFPSGDGVFSVIELDGGRLTIVGATAALTNERIINHGNAAFALGVLGAESALVWYLPTIADIPEVDEETLASLTPGWVTPVLTLLALTFIAAAVWRGRRFGPLVVENLPVTVRASETMLGRARLYERSSSRLRALDSLRVGSMQRLAVLCGLPRTASVDDVIASCAAVTGRQMAGIRALLIETEPVTDGDLMTLSDDLLILERDVARAIRP